MAVGVPNAARLLEDLPNKIRDVLGVMADVRLVKEAGKELVWNPGRLPPDWTVANLAEKHASLPYNPDVANAFFRAGMIESWGQGFERIYSSCQAAGVPRPQLRYEATGLWVEFTWTKRSVRESSDECSQRTLGKTLGKTPDLILGLLKEDAQLTVESLAHHLAKSESAVNRAILKLQAQRSLRRVGSRKGGHWEVVKKE